MLENTENEETDDLGIDLQAYMKFINSVFVQKERENKKGSYYYILHEKIYMDKMYRELYDELTDNGLKHDDFTREWFASCFEQIKTKIKDYYDDGTFKMEFDELSNFIDKMRDDEELSIESDVYWSDLLEWISVSNESIEFLDEVLKEEKPTEFFALVQSAQSHEIDESIGNAIIVAKWIAENFDDLPSL